MMPTFLAALATFFALLTGAFAISAAPAEMSKFGSLIVLGLAAWAKFLGFAGTDFLAFLTVLTFVAALFARGES